MKKIFPLLLCGICLYSGNARSQNTDDTLTDSRSDYTTGVFVLNEDWFGHQNSTINYFTDSCTWVYRVFQKENPGHELGCTSQFGTIYDGRIYIVSKQEKDGGATITGSRLAVCDARTMKLEKEFADIAPENGNSASADGRTFLGIDRHTGYLGTSNGIYLFDIDKMSIGAMIENTGNASGSLYDDQIGMMTRVGRYAFAVHQAKGLLVIDTETHTLETIIEGKYNSVIPARDGNLWLSSNDNLVCLDPYTLKTEQHPVPVPLPESWYAWTADPFCASYQENKIYWAYSQTNDWWGQDVIYCYDIDNESRSEIFDFGTYDDGSWTLYHAGFRIHPVTDDIYAMIYRSNTSRKYRMLRLSKNGGETWEVAGEYDLESNYWFPALVIFPDTAAPVVSDEFPDKIVFDSEQRRFSLYLGDKVSDDDNLACTIVKSVITTNKAVLDARIENDSLIAEPVGNGTATLTVVFNSNGKTVEKEISVTVSGLSGNRETAMSEKTYRIYPNPAQRYFTINTEESVTVDIFGLDGQRLLSSPAEKGAPISVETLPAGLYMVRISTSSGNGYAPLLKQ